MLAVSVKGHAGQLVQDIVTGHVKVLVWVLVKVHVLIHVEVHAKKIALRDVGRLVQADAQADVRLVARVDNTTLIHILEQYG
jgi:hypothetical protein